MWLGAGDPVVTMDRVRRADPTLANLTAVLTIWRNELGSDPITSAAVIAKANEVISFSRPGLTGPDGKPGPEERLRRDAHPLLRAALLQVAERGGKIDTRILGNWLGKNAGRVIDIGENGASEEVVLEAGPLLHGSGQWHVVQNKRMD